MCGTAGTRRRPYRTLASDFRIVDSAGNTVAHGPGGYLRGTTTFRRALPGAHFSLEEIIEEGDRVAVRLSLRGVHGATFHGIAPTGASIVIDGVIFYRLAAGQIIERWANGICSACCDNSARLSPRHDRLHAHVTRPKELSLSPLAQAARDPGLPGRV